MRGAEITDRRSTLSEGCNAAGWRRRAWSSEAAAMFLTGQPLRSAYRVISRYGRVFWF